MGRSVVRVVLRQLDLSDATLRYLSWFHQPEIRQWIKARPNSLRSLRGYIQAQREDKNIMFWGIFVEGRHVGNIKAKRQGHVAVLGLFIGEGRGRGYGTAAIRAAARWCFRRWGIREIGAGIHPHNRPSLKAFQNAGFAIRWPDRIWAIKRR